MWKNIVGMVSIPMIARQHTEMLIIVLQKRILWYARPIYRGSKLISGWQGWHPRRFPDR